MGLKFGKGSVTILPGVKISLNKSGPSITIGKKGAKLTGKLRGWCNYKLGDEIKVSFDRMHFFDKETTNAIREGK